MAGAAGPIVGHAGAPDRVPGYHHNRRRLPRRRRRCRSRPFTIGSDLYGPLAADALRFFTLQRSGIAIDDTVAPGYGRPAGHVGMPPNRGDTRVRAWTGPDAERLYPGWRCDGEFDVQAVGTTPATTGSTSSMAGCRSHNSSRRTSAPANRTSRDRHRRPTALLTECRWELDWMLRMQVPAGKPLSGMAFHRVHGTEWTPLPMWPHEDPTERVLHRPSTAATLTWRPPPPMVRGCSPTWTPPTPLGCSMPPVSPTAPAHEHPMLLAPDDHGASAVVRTATKSSTTSSTGRLSRCSSPPTTTIPGRSRAITMPSRRRVRPRRLRLGPSGGPGPTRPGHDRQPAHGPDTGAAVRDQRRGPDHRDPADATMGAALHAGRGMGLGLQRSDPQQPGRARNSATTSAPDRLPRRRRSPAWISCSASTPSARATSRDTAPITPVINGPATSPTNSTPRSRPRHRGAIAGGPNSKSYPGFPSDDRLRGLPPQLCYLDEPSSETTNDVCIRWNAASGLDRDVPRGAPRRQSLPDQP